MTEEKLTKDILFYDGHCPLCSKEVAFLQQNHDGQLILQDIHSHHDTLINRQAMLKQLHLLTATGEWIIGLDATVRAWSHTTYGIFFTPLQWPIIKPISHKLYQYWARKRYQKRYSCHDCIDDCTKGS